MHPSEYNYIRTLMKNGMSLQQVNKIRRIPMKKQLEIAKLFMSHDLGVHWGNKTEPYFTEKEALTGYVFDGKLTGWELEIFNEL
jgi:hypothetical protein